MMTRPPRKRPECGASFSKARAKKAQGQAVLDLPTGALSVEVKGAALEIRDRRAADRPAASLRCSGESVIGLISKAVTLARRSGSPARSWTGTRRAGARALGVPALSRVG